MEKSRIRGPRLAKALVAVTVSLAAAAALMPGLALAEEHNGGDARAAWYREGRAGWFIRGIPVAADGRTASTASAVSDMAFGAPAPAAAPAPAPAPSNGCPELIAETLGEAGCKIAFCESAWNASAVGAHGELGWFQIHPRYHRDATADPAGNLAAAVRISRGGASWNAWSVRSVLQTGVCPNGIRYPG